MTTCGVRWTGVMDVRPLPARHSYDCGQPHHRDLPRTTPNRGTGAILGRQTSTTRREPVTSVEQVGNAACCVSGQKWRQRQRSRQRPVHVDGGLRAVSFHLCASRGERRHRSQGNHGGLADRPQRRYLQALFMRGLRALSLFPLAPAWTRGGVDPAFLQGDG